MKSCVKNRTSTETQIFFEKDFFFSNMRKRKRKMWVKKRKNECEKTFDGSFFAYKTIMKVEY